VVRKALALIAIAVPLTLAACGGSNSSSSSTAASDTGASSTTAASTTEDNGGGGGGGGTAAGGGSGGSVAISETEYKLTPSDPTAKAGKVTFDVSNDGGTVHDLEIEGNGVEEETEPIGAGSSAKLSVDLKPGTYEIYCNIDSHRQQGMEGTLTVQ
jgi:uncharacterized cupredoxin-like copper-binding protein